ncbi:hypothetical protein GCM10010978_16910 [Compostibacillus humi]|jgi:hypothetical protein|uniref:Sulfurtransferase n=1 Tax=Compostibacillus humi TaxID=1245525 RepID=A0A8J2XEL0_9BACI|nr:sulfurtransferase [Compostibacillus humi]GFZ75918.1 hypothetical protein GCM10010978_16910 [Compostibacillus humi]HLT56093.1 sulfurtransferase [Bacillota bacterium]
MSIYLFIVAAIAIVVTLYRRYFPVLGIPCKKTEGNNSSSLVLDIRDYNTAQTEDSDLRIPYAYLKRYIREIPKKKLHVVANDRLELNLGLRYLKSKGFEIESFEISSCPCTGKE